MFLAALLASLLALSAASPAAAVNGAEVIERMQKRLAGSKTFSARFEKRFYWAVLDRKLTQSGRIYTRKPGRFRVEVGKDVVVADGRSIWAYTEQNNQVIVSDFDSGLQTPWEILVDYADSFTPVSLSETELSGRPCYAVVLQPAGQGAAGEKGAASGGWRSGWTRGAGSCCRSSSWRTTATCEPTSCRITSSTRSSTTTCSCSRIFPESR